MMNIFIFLLFFLYSGVSECSGKKNIPFSQALENKRYYYSALNEFFLETYNKAIQTDDLSRLEDLLYYTGIELLEDYDSDLLGKYPSSSTRFILARQMMEKKKFKSALELFSLVHKDHRYFPEAKLLEAKIHNLNNNLGQMLNSYNQCQVAALKGESNAPNEKVKRYFRMIHEVCIINKARHFYAEEKYREALDTYDQIPKKSYKWPYLLLEKAWAHYQLGDYNRTLGLLTTYKSPLLETYFFPEAEYLAALSYFRLCLYEDSLVIVNQYYNQYRPRFQSIVTEFRKNNKSKKYFFQLLFKTPEDVKSSETFLNQLLTRLKKQTRFSLDFNAVYKLNQEIKRITSNEKKLVRKKLLPHLLEVKSNLESKINFNAKKDLFDFLDTIPFLSQEMYKLNLEIISRKKDLVYMNKKLISDRSRGDYSNIKRSRFDYFWTFEGAFWADELGDYSLGLKSNCGTVSINSQKE